MNIQVCILEDGWVSFSARNYETLHYKPKNFFEFVANIGHFIYMQD